MTEIVGGLRARFLHDSLFNTVHAGLAALGWLDTGRHHAPLRFVAKRAHWDETVEANTVAMDIGIVVMEDLELGSGLTGDEIAVTFDFLAENDSIGVDISNDIRDLLRGRLEVGPPRPVFDLLDYRHATPVKIGYANVEEVRIERPGDIVTQTDWRRYWFQIRCVIRDAYTDEYSETTETGEEVDPDTIYTESGQVLVSESGAAIVREF